MTNFEAIAVADIKTGNQQSFALSELPKNYEIFLPLIGVETISVQNEWIADRRAAERLAELFDEIVHYNGQGFDRHAMNQFLSRILFCYFAEDTNIFEDNQFTNFIATHTAESGEDVHIRLAELFQLLDQKENERRSDLPNFLQNFPYVNGKLFQENTEIPRFNAKSRKILSELGKLNWAEINPDIFGSMLQGVMDPKERWNLGAHYTSVENIMKLIKPLFLDELREEAEKAKWNKAKTEALIMRMRKIKFFDPACGSGNFLIIIYKALRDIEIELLESTPSIVAGSSIELNQFYGIEISDFAAQTAKLSLYLAKHQMDIKFTERIRRASEPLPLRETGVIFCANAATIDWDEVCPRNQWDEIYIVGNPPYLWSRNQNNEQKEDLKHIFKKDYKSLDYVSIWFYKWAQYILDYNIKCAFVSTNSICQWLLVSLLWKRIFDLNVEIDFAYTSFKWSNNAKKNAWVTVIIVGLRNISNKPKFLFDSKGNKKLAKNINAYLLDFDNIIVDSQNYPISNFPKMNFGNMPADNGYLLFSEYEKEDFINKEPWSKKFFKELISSQEFLNWGKRFCLWLEWVNLEELRRFPLINDRIEKIRKIRQESSRPQLANIPHLFAQITQPWDQDFILIPTTTSENREYIPMWFFDKNLKTLNTCLIIASAQIWLLGVLHSKMHMIWVDVVGGKLKTDYRYSAKLCYNTFPFPHISETQKKQLEDLIIDILDIRAEHIGRTLADLYDPDTMPDDLRQAHHALDLFVESCYRDTPFETNEERLVHLFDLYSRMIAEEEKWKI